MSRFTCYITPFLEDGTYGTEVEVTDHVIIDSFSNISQQIDSNEYDVGVLTFNDLDVRLRNESGLYSEPSVVGSMFRYKRSDSIFRVAWQIENQGCVCGFATAGLTKLSTVETVYEGLINDEASTTDLVTQQTTLKVLNMESILSKVLVPFASLSVGMTVSQIALILLNQTAITNLLTVDIANLVPLINTVTDSIEDLETMTVKEAFDELLKISNSILYVKNRIVYMKARTPGASVAANFYGPMSINGLENIQNISKIKTGMSQMFNYLKWKDTTIAISDADSITAYGIKKKEFDSTLVTDTTKRQTILTSYANEFAFPHENFVLHVPVNYETIGLFFLDRIAIDFPTIYSIPEDREIAVYGLTKYGQAYYPVRESTLTIEFERRFKIVGIDIDVDNQLFEFNIREIE